LRNGIPVAASELTHLTDDFSREAALFIATNRESPFFLYLAYNAPHAPDEVTRAHLKKTEHIEYGGRAVYGAMVAAMDDGIGQVLRALDKCQLRERTLIFFFSDNGGRNEHAVNFPFRGHKGMLFEGGVRVPFCVAWPGRLPSGVDVDAPVSALDIFPTALAAAGAANLQSYKCDGIDLLPYLVRPRDVANPRTFFWRCATGVGEFSYAVRDGDWKLVSSDHHGATFLFNLAADPSEKNDLSSLHPQIAGRLLASAKHWAEGMRSPRWNDAHGANVRKEEAARRATVDRASRGERR
jgi:arylsulfatase A-like enzyme